MTFGQIALKHPSLSSMVDAINARMSREALHLRFTPEAAAYLDKCLKFVLRQKVKQANPIQAKLLRPFNRVLIIDSSSWDINPKLKDVLPGSGGGASEANCKLQMGYEYKKGELAFFKITPGTKPDNSYTDQLPALIRKNDLVLFDQGYFKFKTFWNIDYKEAFFLTRFRIGTNLQDSETKTYIDLEQLLKKLSVDEYEISVIMGSEEKKKVHCRLLCMRTNELIANKRRRQLKKQARKKGRKPSQKHLTLCNWTLMVTNVPEKKLPLGMVRPLYSLRWQIELLFKQLKSILQIHKSDTKNENRLRCEIYGKLIVAVLIHRIHAAINIPLWNRKRRELSIDKLYKRIQERAFLFMKQLLLSWKEAIIYFRKEIKRLIKNCIKYPQLSRKTTLEMLEFTLIKEKPPYGSCLT